MVDAVSGLNVSGVQAAKGSQVSVQVMAALVMLEIAGTKKGQAELKINDMKTQNDRAKAINAFLDKYTSKMSQFSSKSDDDDKRLEASKALADEAVKAGIFRSDDSIVNSMKNAKTNEGVSAVKTEIQHLSENCNSDNQTQMVKLQDFMGQYNSFMSGANDAVKQANQVLQSLAKN